MNVLLFSSTEVEIIVFEIHRMFIEVVNMMKKRFGRSNFCLLA